MLFDSLRLFLWLSLGFSVTSSLGQGLQLEAALEKQCYAHDEQEPVFVTTPAQKSGGTIYKILSEDPKFSRVTKAVNFVEDVASLLDDSSAQLTFFAPPDKVLRRPDHHPHDIQTGRTTSYSTFLSSIMQDIEITGGVDEFKYVSEFGNLEEAIRLLEEVEGLSMDSNDEKKCKEILKIILRAVLHYHIIPEGHDIDDLNRNTTYPTKLAIPGASDGQPIRLRVSQSVIPPFTAINFFVRVSHPNIKAKNGVIHVVNHPIIPPPSAFQELYLVPRHFSTLTSALQRSGLTKDVDLRYVRDKGLTGASLVTVFAPTNRAFRALPLRLQLFLFSPFGERVLKKLLQYHIAPSIVVHSNYIHRSEVPGSPDSTAIAHSAHSPDEGDLIDPGSLFDIEQQNWPVLSWIMRFFPSGLIRRGAGKPHVEPIFSTNITLDTLFTNHSLHAHISQHKVNFPFPGPKQPSVIDTKIFVNHYPVVAADIVSFNGVIHVIDRLLDPRKGKGHHDHDHHHQKSSHIRKSDQFERSSNEHHHHHHHKHHKHHKHQKADTEVEEYNDDVWNDWENWLNKWADEQN